MPKPRSLKLLTVILTPLMITSCKGDQRPAQIDSSAVVAKSGSTVAAGVPTNGWNESEAGAVLIVSIGEQARQAAVVLPAVSDIHAVGAQLSAVDSVRGNEFDLFDRTGHAAVATLESISRPSSEGCSAWPTGSFRDTPAHGWRIGFEYQMAKALPLDSLEGMQSADSTTVTTELARLSSIATVKGDPSFEGLPFTVREAYRLQLPEASVIIGDVVRTINEEANPREEHLLLLAEKENGSSSYHTAFYSRSAGSEEEVRTSEVLAAVRFANTKRPAVVVSFGYAEGDRIALLERVAIGNWKITWRSAYSGC